MYDVNLSKNRDCLRRRPERERFSSDFNRSSANLSLTLKLMVNSHTKLGFLPVDKQLTHLHHKPILFLDIVYGLPSLLLL